MDCKKGVAYSHRIQRRWGILVGQPHSVPQHRSLLNDRHMVGGSQDLADEIEFFLSHERAHLATEQAGTMVLAAMEARRKLAGVRPKSTTTTGSG